MKKITHPEILKTERLGSREGGIARLRCSVCGAELLDSGYISATGEIFCSVICRLTKINFNGGMENDKK